MRESQEILKIVLDKAAYDKRILAVVLTGSRANPEIPADPFQDYDFILVVEEFESFLKDQSWLEIFGDRIIMQIPELMFTGEAGKKEPALHFLMLFTDGNRIDLTLTTTLHSKQYCSEDPFQVLLDKNNILAGIPLSPGKNRLIKKPVKKEFQDVCNECWWVSANIAKGLARGEPGYAREMFEIPVRSMFMKMIEWHIGVESSFSVSFGKGGRFMKKQVSPSLYQDILLTYPDGDPENTWKALFRLLEIFGVLSKAVAKSLGFSYKRQEEEGIIKYLEQVYRDTKTR